MLLPHVEGCILRIQAHTLNHVLIWGGMHLFDDYCRTLQQDFPSVTFFGGHGAHEPNWGIQYFDFKTEYPFFTEYHASVLGGIFPWLWSWRHRKEITMLKADPERIYMIDYI